LGAVPPDPNIEPPLLPLFCVNSENMWLMQLYHSESIYLVLVGVEVWTTEDLITIVTRNATLTLENFCLYRFSDINPDHNNDNAFLIT